VIHEVPKTVNQVEKGQEEQPGYETVELNSRSIKIKTNVGETNA